MKLLCPLLRLGFFWDQPGVHQWSEVRFSGVVLGKWFFGLARDVSL